MAGMCVGFVATIIIVVCANDNRYCRCGDRPMAEPDPKRLRPAKREAIVSAATRLFLQRGFVETGMESVAELASVGIKTVYRHFDNKEQLFEAVLLEACRTERIGNPQGVFSGPIDDVLLEASQTYLAMVLSAHEIGLWRLAVAESARVPRLAELVSKSLLDDRERYLARYFRECQSRGELASGDASRMARELSASLRFPYFERALVRPDRLPSRKVIRDHTKRVVTQFWDRYRPDRSASVDADRDG